METKQMNKHAPESFINQQMDLKKQKASAEM